MPNSSTFDACAEIKSLLQHEYKEFRLVLTRLELETESVSVASLNELKYAIDHLARVVDENSDFPKEQQLQRAKSHLLRGIIDAKEALILPKLAKLNKSDAAVAMEASEIIKKLSDYKAGSSSNKWTTQQYLGFLDDIDRSMEHADRLLKEHQLGIEYAIRKDKQSMYWKAMLWATFGALVSAMASYLAKVIGL